MSRIISVFVVLATLSLASPLFAQSIESKEIAKMFGEIANETSTPVALAKFAWIQEHADYIPRREYAAGLEAAYKNVKNPLLRFRIFRSLQWTWRELKDPRGKPYQKTGLLPAQGCVRHWSLVGPFDNPSMEGHEQTFGPELGETGPFTGRFGQIDWRELPEHDRRCVLGLKDYVYPSTSATVYLASKVVVKKAQAATLLLGANGGYKVWVNGKIIGEKRDDFGLAIDADGWEVNLKKGANQIVVKLSSEQDGNLGAIVRLVDRRTLKPIETSAKPLPNPAKLSNDSQPKATATSVLGAIAKSSKSASGDEGAWLAVIWEDDANKDAATPWRNVADRLLEEPKDLSTRVLVRLASTYEEHWRRVQILKRAADRNDWPLANVEYAKTLESGLTWLAKLNAKKRYDETIKNAPDLLTAHYRRFDWEFSNGSSRSAQRLLKTIPASTSPMYLRRKLNIAKRLGTEVEIRAIEQQIFETMYFSGGVVWDWDEKLVRDQKVDEALKLVRQYLSWHPGSKFASKRVAKLLEVKGKTSDALELLSTWSAWSPGDDDLYNKRADILIRDGKTNEAIASLQSVLIYQPQNQEVRQRLTFLKPEETPFWETWTVADVRKIAERHGPSEFNYDSVIDQTVTQVSSNGLSSQFVQRVDRVNTAEGVEAANSHRVSYQTGDEEVEVIRVVVHKKDGSLSEDFDQWDSGGTRKASTTYNDTAYLTLRANDVEPGDLIEFRYRVSQVANENFRGDYFGDISYLQGGRPIGFQRYALVYPDSWNLYFRNPTLKHTKTENKFPNGDAPPAGFRSTTFELTDVPYVKTDSRQPGHTEVYDYILVSNKKTYDDVGVWWWNLVKEQLIVDEPIRNKVAELVKGKKKESDKLKAIHNYVVKNTRYLHVGLGIHGWKPYRTTTCFRNRFGDCKDKASLLKVMLEEAGIDANLVLVRTRRLGDIDSHPASMHIFNHAITYVPKYDLFLDGTAEFNGTSELTSMDQGARALIVQNGGKTKWVKLPVDKAKANNLAHDMEVDLRGDQPKVKGKVIAHGANAVYYREALQDPERRDEVFEKQLAAVFPGAKLATAKYTNLSDLERPTVIEYEMNGGQLVRTDGDREYVLPAGSPKDLLKNYAQQSTRTQDLTIRLPFSNNTKIRYVLKESNTVKRLPKDATISSRFGKVEIQYKKIPKGLAVDVEYSIDTQRVKVEDYPEFRQFLVDATTALNASIDIGADQ